MLQKFVDVSILLSRQAREDVLELQARIVPVEFRRLDQAHDRSGALAREERAGERNRFAKGVIHSRTWLAHYDFTFNAVEE
jgi:hypothetical protein